MSGCGCSSKKKEQSLDSQIQSLFGGRVVMPSEYYGVDSGRYSGGSCSCNSELPMLKGGKRRSRSRRKSHKKRKSLKRRR
jgi:hypothetical protein